MKKCGLCKSTLVSKNKGSLLSVRIRGLEMLAFREILRTYLMDGPLMSYFRRTKKKQHQKIKTRYHLLKFDITAKQYLHKKIAQSWRKTWLSTIWQNPSTFRHKSAKTSWEANLYSFWMISYYDVIGGNNIFKVNVESLEQSVKYVQS